MSIVDWGGYGAKIVAGAGAMAQPSPEIVKGYGMMSKTGAALVHATRVLDACAAAEASAP